MSAPGDRESSPTGFPHQDGGGSEDDLSVTTRLMRLFSFGYAPGPLQTSHSFQWSDDSSDEASVSTHRGPSRRIIDALSSVRNTESPAEAAHGVIGRMRGVFNQGGMGTSPLPNTTSTQDGAGELTLDEPPYPNQPGTWSPHHEFFLLSCRGTVQVITDHLQAIFDFSPPLLGSFVRSKLVNNARRQIAFLQTYLPGETHSMLRAEARIVLVESGLTDPDVFNGAQNLDILQYDLTDPRYTYPEMPPGLPPSEDWAILHDNHLFLFLGDSPQVFLTQCRHLFRSPPTSYFIAVRMAQLPFLDLNATRLNKAAVTSRYGVVRRQGMFF